MRLEIQSAANFITKFLRKMDENNDKNLNIQLEQFCSKLENMLFCHFQNHWFPEKPCKGSGYRCIRINNSMDPIILKAGSECGFDEESLRQAFPLDLCLWIDPREVSYRIGMDGSICVLFKSAPAPCQLPNGSSYDRTPPRTVTVTGNRNPNNFMRQDIRNYNSHNFMMQNNCYSPMITSSPSPIYSFAPSWQASMRGTGDSWYPGITDPRNINY